jgi:hypothetical protein
MTLIEAAKQALEALEKAHPKPYNESVISHVEAITALRTAIEQAEKQEPVAQIIALGQYEFPGLEWLSADHSFRAPIGTLLYTTPPAAPVQEPVTLETVYETIIYWDEGGGKRSRRELARRIVNLYTTPPAAQRQWITFPTMLRKMWSGGEVQAWLDENVNREKNT